jgi:2-phosphosulfolactate phosphatase
MWIDCDWGEQGLTHLVGTCDVVVIVDVLTFSSAAELAVSRGAWVYPYHWMVPGGRELAAQVGGVLAGPYGEGGYSLSPASLTGIPAGTRLVLPSPNGAVLSLLAGQAPTLAGCLRNAQAVAREAARLGQHIGVLAAGERWEDGSLQMAMEDWLGTGAIVAALAGERTMEAELAARSFASARDDLESLLAASRTGRGLIGRGRRQDVFLAAQLDASQCVPCKQVGGYFA